MPRFYPTVEIAPGATVTGNPNTYSWTDLTMQRYVHLPSGINIRRGRQDRYSSADADHCSLTLINTSGIFVPRNPLGTWYGTLRPGTPLRVLMRPNTNSASDGFGRTASNSWGSADVGGAWTVVGTAGDYAVSTTNGGRMTSTAAAVNHVAVLGTSVLRVDLKVKVRVNALSTGAAQSAGVVLRYADSSNYERGVVEFGTTGVLTARVVSRVAGVETPGTGVTVSGLTHSTSTWYWVRFQSGYTSVRMKVWADGTSEPATWTMDGGTSALFGSSAGYFGCFSRRETGNTNASATTDFDDFSMVDGPRTQFTGFVDAWPVRWSDEGMAQAFAPITATGQLQRVSRGQQRRSSIYRAITQYLVPGTSTVVAYWPMEDGTNAGSFAAAIGGAATAFTGDRGDVSPAGDSQVNGSDPLPTFRGIGSIRYQVPAYAASTTWAVRWLMKIPAGSFTSGAQVMSWTMPGGSPIVRWQLTLTSGSPDTLALTGFSYTGTSFSGTAVNFVDSSSSSSLADGRQLYFEVDGTQNGGNVDTNWNVWYMADDGSGPVGLGLAQSTAATNANIASIYHDAVTGFVTGGHTIGHVMVGTDPLSGASSTGVTGAAGDATTGRFTNLTNELGIVGFVGDLVRGVGSTSEQLMGVQDTQDALAELQEIEATELGTLHDGKQGFIELLPRSMKYNRPVDLTLNFATGQVDGPFEPSDDNFLLRNDVSVSNNNGSNARSTDPDSIALAGVYPERASVNTYRDTDLQSHADWRKALGTAETLRYPSIGVNLTRNYTALADSWCNTDIGSRIQITNLPSGELPPDTIDLLVDGYTENLSSTEWTATLNCSPAGPWTVIELDDTSLARLGADGSTLQAAATSSATSLRVLTDNWQGTLWSTTSVPYDLAIGGERVTATAVASSFTDSFTRTVSSGWGTADSGQSWTVSGGSAADYSTTGSRGQMSLTSTGVERTATLSATVGTDVEIVVFFRPTAVATGAAFEQKIRYRYGSGYYETNVQFMTTGVIDLYLTQTVTPVQTVSSALAYTAASVIGVRVRVIGSSLKHRIWDAAVTSEPSTWTVATTNSVVTGTSSDTFQVAAQRIGGNTNAGLAVQFDDFYIPNPQLITVTRSVNGISKAQTAGTTVQLWTPGRLAA